MAALSPALVQPVTRRRVLCFGKHGMRSNDKTKTGRGVKSVPDNEVMLTFWGDVDVQTEHNTTRQMQKYQALFYKAAEVAIFSIDYPPDKAGTQTAPEDPSNRASDIILLHPHAVSETSRREA